MPVWGVVAEYNPFHSGHAWQITELRKRTEDCAVVAVMSGNWVQRGDAAITDKWSRAGLALRGGVDLVLELPTVWAVSSAERFALGGVSVLQATGVVDALCFGSEAGELTALQKAADCLECEEYPALLRQELARGQSFAAARQRAVNALIGAEGDCLALPNNILGFEYLRAIKRLGADMEPFTVPRQGAGHDSRDESTYPSASALREKILAGGGAIKNPAALAFNERGVLTKLRGMTAADFAALPDCTEGLEHRLWAAAQQANTLPEFYEAVKTKRYAHARIRRMAIWAYLGLTAADRAEKVPYLRVLGLNGRGQTLLREMKKKGKLPIVTKPAHAKKLDEAGRRLFQLECRNTDLWQMCRRELTGNTGGSEWITGPVILEEKR